MEGEWEKRWRMKENNNFLNERHLLQTNSDVCQELRGTINSPPCSNSLRIFLKLFSLNNVVINQVISISQLASLWISFIVQQSLSTRREK